MPADLAAQSVNTASTDPLSDDQLSEMLEKLDDWEVNDAGHFEKSWSFGDFLTALHFVTRIAEEAEAGQHHPDILLKWGYVGVELWTHDVDALTMKDVVLAARLDRLA